MKKFSKLLKLASLIISILVLICECEKGSYTIKNGEFKADKNTYIGRYQNSYGYIEYSLGNVKRAKPDYCIETKSGSVKFYILNENGEEIESSEKDKGAITIDKEMPNKYILRIEGDNHEGNYEILLYE